MIGADITWSSLARACGLVKSVCGLYPTTTNRTKPHLRPLLVSFSSVPRRLGSCFDAAEDESRTWGGHIARA
eukprot:7759343-Alexandrium_andersonii.AAC.1